MMQFIVSLVLLCRTLNAFPLETMAKIVDQDDAAGGYMYSYRSDSNGPSQMYYLEKPEEIIDLRQFNDFEAPAEPSAQPLLFYPASFPSSTNAPYYSSHYDADILPYLASYKTQHVPTVTPQYKPSAKLVKYNNRKPSRGSEEKFAKYQQKAPSSGSYSSSDETGESNGDKSEYKKHSDHSDHAAHHKGGSHQEEGGQEHEEQFKKKSGKKSSKDYKSESHFDKAAKGSYDKEDHAGEDEEEGAHKEAKYDGYDKHSEHESSGKNKKGGQFKAKKQHKKGSKTTGYHNVFMKDEYKKDHTFYDDADHEGEFKKYGSNHKDYKKDAKEVKLGHHHGDGFKEEHHEKKGGAEKGNYDQKDQGYKKKKGHAQKFSHKDTFEKDGGLHGHSEHGFKH